MVISPRFCLKDDLPSAPGKQRMGKALRDGVYPVPPFLLLSHVLQLPARAQDGRRCHIRNIPATGENDLGTGKTTDFSCSSWVLHFFLVRYSTQKTIIHYVVSIFTINRAVAHCEIIISLAATGRVIVASSNRTKPNIHWWHKLLMSCMLA